ncbi:hypothetical protein MPER_08241 [Moniliophthora perniciosa FA553]|nr:hypothetical protein MPER_08241 [Moniliophthora perniciosa FA553]
MSISNSSTIRFGDGNTLNNVGRDQITQFITAGVVNVYDTAIEDEEYKEFEYVKRGDMYIVKKIHAQETQDWEWNDETLHADRAIYIIEIRGHPAMRFTVVSYHGHDATKLWKGDFLEDDETSAQLFGINQSHIPSLIFYNELIPVSSLVRKSWFWGYLALSFLEVIRIMMFLILKAYVSAGDETLARETPQSRIPGSSKVMDRHENRSILSTSQRPFFWPAPTGFRLLQVQFRAVGYFDTVHHGYAQGG